MNGARAMWEVRVELATGIRLGTDVAARTTAALTDTLQCIPGIERAWASLSWWQFSITLGATVVLEAASAGEALDAAVLATTQAAAAIGIIAESMAEAEIKPAVIDPRG